MSRLDSFIRRLTAQRDIIDHVAAALSLPAGDVLELGLGNGRTYSHLREAFPDRRIIAFDRALAAHPDSTPRPEDLTLGEIRDTTRGFEGCGAALVHADIGKAFAAQDRETLTWLPARVAAILAPGGIAASGLPLDHPALSPLPLPGGVEVGRYFLYLRGAA